MVHPSISKLDHHWFLVHVIACCLNGAKTLSEPLLKSSLKKIHLIMLSVAGRPFCFTHSVLETWLYVSLNTTRACKNSVESVGTVLVQMMVFLLNPMLRVWLSLANNCWNCFLAVNKYLDFNWFSCSLRLNPSKLSDAFSEEKKRFRY